MILQNLYYPCGLGTVNGFIPCFLKNGKVLFCDVIFTKQNKSDVFVFLYISRKLVLKSEKSPETVLVNE